jgi:hypothetical protein
MHLKIKSGHRVPYNKKPKKTWISRADYARQNVQMQEEEAKG